MKRQEYEFKAAKVRNDMLAALSTTLSDQIINTVIKKKPGIEGIRLLLKFVSDRRNQNIFLNLPIRLVKDTDELMYRLITFIENELKIDWKD